jgi:hypothetical protein
MDRRHPARSDYTSRPKSPLVMKGKGPPRNGAGPKAQAVQEAFRRRSRRQTGDRAGVHSRAVTNFNELTETAMPGSAALGREWEREDGDRVTRNGRGCRAWARRTQPRGPSHPATRIVSPSITCTSAGLIGSATDRPADNARTKMAEVHRLTGIIATCVTISLCSEQTGRRRDAFRL